MQEEKEFFDRLYSNCQFVMVRSTGIEDSQTVANAGGNVSCSYVKPELGKIQHAMADVVASYFSMQSLKNCLASGEQLSSELCIPVLIQELVGEVPNGVIDDAQVIPISGVAFTTNQTLSSDSMKITEINASYGHGEGIVANKVQTDKYYMLPSRASQDIAIYPLLTYKPERLIPRSFDPYYSASYSVRLDRTNNSEKLAYKSSLSQEQLKKLYQVLQRIELAYRQPMDVEFVIRDSTIYIVQARPAMHVQVNPSFVSLEQLPKGNIMSSMETITIVPGKAQVLVLTNPNDIIISKTLDEADQMPNSTTAKVVLVGAWASSLSHAAVNFMSHGTPCLYVQNYNQIQSLQSQISKMQPLVIDVQQRRIFLWKNNNSHSIDQFITKGWYECPISGALSISLDQLPPVRLHQNPLPLDARLVSMTQALKTASVKSQKRDLLESIVHRTNELFLLTERRINHLAPFRGDSLKEAFDLFKQQFNRHIEQMKACIEQNGESIEFLFYHKLLEAFLFQQPGNRSILNGFNYSYFLNELYDSQQLCMLFRKLKILGFDKNDPLYNASQFAP
ncbi:MAG TPA: PEP/pyruvate-binding domain-containing protein, partial [Candidatus Babeliaceae bacterium]|nr:PEP/pyruvate-binding domain-containing protein [Candidatus Babeliaceae bacterium]